MNVETLIERHRELIAVAITDWRANHDDDANGLTIMIDQHHQEPHRWQVAHVPALVAIRVAPDHPRDCTEGGARSS